MSARDGGVPTASAEVGALAECSPRCAARSRSTSTCTTRAARSSPRNSLREPVSAIAASAISANITSASGPDNARPSSPAEEATASSAACTIPPRSAARRALHRHCPSSVHPVATVSVGSTGSGSSLWRTRRRPRTVDSNCATVACSANSTNPPTSSQSSSARGEIARACEYDTRPGPSHPRAPDEPGPPGPPGRDHAPCAATSHPPTATTVPWTPSPTAPTRPGHLNHRSTAGTGTSPHSTGQRRK